MLPSAVSILETQLQAPLFFTKRKARKRNDFAFLVTSKQKAIFHAISICRDRTAVNFIQAFSRLVPCGHAPKRKARKRNDFALQAASKQKATFHAISTYCQIKILPREYASCSSKTLARHCLRGLRAAYFLRRVSVVNLSCTNIRCGKCYVRF